MRYLLLALLFACSSTFAADFRFGVEIGPRVFAPAPVTIVQQEELVWVPPAYETRVDEDGNVYTVMVRQGYYVRQVRPVYVVQPSTFFYSTYSYLRPTFGFSFGFGGYPRGGCSSYGGHSSSGHRR
jgi:hypothetical protein